MNRITYKVIKHDGSWAYQASGIVSRQFPTREAARKAARLAAAAHAANGQAAAAQAAVTVSTPRSSEDYLEHWSDDTG